MRKFILVILLACVSINAMAETKAKVEVEAVEVGNGFGDFRVFAYPSSIKKLGGDVTMWDLFNASTPQNLPGHSPFLSKVSQVQYSCEKMRMRTLYTNIWSLKDGKGAKILFKDTTNLLEWKPVQPGTAHEALFNFACGKR